MSNGTDNGRATIRDVYDIVNRIEDKIDERLSTLDNRVSSLERWRSWAVGIAAACGFGLTLAVRFL